jgi:cyclase
LTTAICGSSTAANAALAGTSTKIVAGHGPLGNTADLTRFRDLLVTVRDRAQKLKAQKPFADLDADWDQSIVNSDQLVQVVYLTL